MIGSINAPVNTYTSETKTLIGSNFKEVWSKYLSDETSKDVNKGNSNKDTSTTSNSNGSFDITNPVNLIYYHQKKVDAAIGGDGYWVGSNSYTSSKTGLTMSSVGDAGCGPTSFAIISANLLNDKSITPDKTVPEFLDLGLYAGNGSAHDSGVVMAKKYGFNSEVIPDNGSANKNKQVKWMKEHLGKGHFLYILVGYTQPTMGGGFTPTVRKVFENKGHFVVLVGLKGDQTMIYDCGNRARVRVWADLEDIWFDLRKSYGAVAIWK